MKLSFWKWLGNILLSNVSDDSATSEIPEKSVVWQIFILSDISNVSNAADKSEHRDVSQVGGLSGISNDALDD